MGYLMLPIGLYEFREIRENNYYYVDKTDLICELLLKRKAKVTLITRPRRFGKSLNMDMMDNFFDICKDSKRLFEGLSIYNNKELCDEWMNQYPTVFITFKDVDGDCFEIAYKQLVYEISLLYKKYDFLLEKSDLSNIEKETFIQLNDRKADVVIVMRSLQFLIQLLNRYYGKKVILLMDEYDVPMAKASSNGYYKEMLEIMKGLMKTLKDNSSLQFAVVTGCLRIAKESIFTGTNNFVSDTITDSRLNEYFGFVQREVDQILEDYDVTEKREQIRDWYDGYHFGEFDVYCPWDVINYVSELKDNPEKKPVSYWKNTSGNSIIRSFIDYAGDSISDKLETLMSGGYIIQRIDENLTYDYLHSSEDNLWSILYLTGYLTKKRESELTETVPEGMIALEIPNAEIREIFQTSITDWFDDTVKTWDRSHLFYAVWNGDCESITKELTSLLRQTISYYDYREDYYHAFLAGIFTGAGYMVKSNRENGEGRSDVVVKCRRDGKVAVFELKIAEKFDQLEKKCNEAIQQTNERKYAEEFEEEYSKVLCYGISFFKKRCLVKKKQCI